MCRAHDTEGLIESNVSLEAVSERKGGLNWEVAGPGIKVISIHVLFDFCCVFLLNVNLLKPWLLTW